MMISTWSRFTRCVVYHSRALACLGVVLVCGCGATPREPERILLDITREVRVAPGGAVRVGPFEVQDIDEERSVEYAALLRVFGSPDVCAFRSGETRVRWRRPGVTAQVFVGQERAETHDASRCPLRDASVRRVVADGVGWHTEVGLAIGDPISRIRELYPGVTRQRRSSEVPGWRLVSRSTDEDIDVSASGLVATVQDGRIAALVVMLAGTEL